MEPDPADRAREPAEGLAPAAAVKAKETNRDLGTGEEAAEGPVRVLAGDKA